MPPIPRSELREDEAFARSFLVAIPPDVRERVEARAVEMRLRAAWRTARAAWPALMLSPSRFGAYLAARVVDAADLDAIFAETTLQELWLTCACAHGEVAAMRQLEARYFPIVAGALVRMRLQPHAVDEILQQLRANLFVARDDAEAGIASFRGRGALAAWLKVSAVRMACQVINAGSREAADGDERLARLSASAVDVESNYAQKWSHDAFKRAFASALAQLCDRDKALLRLHYIDGVSLDQLGNLYRTHRATAARWLAASRQRLLDATRASLADEHRIPLAECDSIIRAAQSQLELTVRRLFADSPPS